MKKKKIIKFLSDNKWAFLQIGLMVLPSAVGYASQIGSTGITPLDKPLEVLNGAFTGVIPKAGVTIALAAGFTSYALGTESQVTKLALRGAMGGGAAMAAPGIINALVDTSSAGQAVAGCLF